jgi:hypothetical protein
MLTHICRWTRASVKIRREHEICRPCEITFDFPPPVGVRRRDPARCPQSRRFRYV